jgi:AhpC/TSA family
MDARLPHMRRLLVRDVRLVGVLVVAGVATAQEVGRNPPGVGEPAPDFTLPRTTGEEINLRECRGKKYVLRECYGVDCAPT